MAPLNVGYPLRKSMPPSDHCAAAKRRFTKPLLSLLIATVRRRHVQAGDQDPGDVPVQPAQGALPHQDLAPEHLVGDGRHLPGHPEGPVGGRHDAAHRAALAAGAAAGGRAGRPAGRRRGQPVQAARGHVPQDGPPLGARLRRLLQGPGGRLRRQGQAARRHGLRPGEPRQISSLLSQLLPSMHTPLHSRL